MQKQHEEDAREERPTPFGAKHEPHSERRGHRNQADDRGPDQDIAHYPSPRIAKAIIARTVPRSESEDSPRDQGTQPGPGEDVAWIMQSEHDARRRHEQRER